VSSCVVVAPIENCSTSKPLELSPEKSQILSCDTFVANEWYIILRGQLERLFLRKSTKQKLIKKVVMSRMEWPVICREYWLCPSSLATELYKIHAAYANCINTSLPSRSACNNSKSFPNEIQASKYLMPVFWQRRVLLAEFYDSNISGRKMSGNEQCPHLYRCVPFHVKGWRRG
jgi:hypothetical protein